MSVSFNGITYASAPPDGVARDVNQPAEATALVVSCIVTLPVATAFVGIRLYTRYFITASVGADDFTMLASLISSAVFIGFIAHMLQHGLGKHLWNVPREPDFYPIWMLDDIFSQFFFVLATMLSRCSILLFYLRIFVTRDMKWAVWSSLSLVICSGTACLVVIIFACDPVSAAWTPARETSAKCINEPMFYYAEAGLFIAMDFLTVLVPMPRLRALRMPLKQKIGVGLMLVIGSAACIVSIYRLHSIHMIQSTTDVTYLTAPGLMWCILELNMSIIGGSMPTLKPFLQRHAPRLLSHSQSKTGSCNTNDVNLAPFRSTFGRLEGETLSGWNTKSGTTVSHSMSRRGEVSLSPIPSNSTDEIPLQGSITKTVCYGYELEEAPVDGSCKKHEDKIMPVLPAFMRDGDVEFKGQ